MCPDASFLASTPRPPITPLQLPSAIDRIPDLNLSLDLTSPLPHIPNHGQALRDALTGQDGNDTMDVDIPDREYDIDTPYSRH